MVFVNGILHLDTETNCVFFKKKGGLGACVSKADVLATTPEELMYLQGRKIKGGTWK